MKQINSCTKLGFWRRGIGYPLLLALAGPSPAGAEPGHAADSPDPGGHRIDIGISEYTDIGIKGPRDKPVTSLDESRSSKSTTDHARLKELQGPFESGSDVTRACLECHNNAGHQFIKNKHWTWRFTHPKTGQELGKGVLVNNF